MFWHHSTGAYIILEQMDELSHWRNRLTQVYRKNGRWNSVFVCMCAWVWLEVVSLELVYRIKTLTCCTELLPSLQQFLPPVVVSQWPMFGHVTYCLSFSITILSGLMLISPGVPWIQGSVSKYNSYARVPCFYSLKMLYLFPVCVWPLSHVPLKLADLS